MHVTVFRSIRHVSMVVLPLYNTTVASSAPVRSSIFTSDLDACCSILLNQPVSMVVMPLYNTSIASSAPVKAQISSPAALVHRTLFHQPSACGITHFPLYTSTFHSTFQAGMSAWLCCGHTKHLFVALRLWSDAFPLYPPIFYSLYSETI